MASAGVCFENGARYGWPAAGLFALTQSDQRLLKCGIFRVIRPCVVEPQEKGAVRRSFRKGAGQVRSTAFGAPPRVDPFRVGSSNGHIASQGEERLRQPHVEGSEAFLAAGRILLSQLRALAIKIAHAVVVGLQAMLLCRSQQLERRARVAFGLVVVDPPQHPAAPRVKGAGVLPDGGRNGWVRRNFRGKNLLELRIGNLCVDRSAAPCGEDRQRQQGNTSPHAKETASVVPAPFSGFRELGWAGSSNGTDDG